MRVRTEEELAVMPAGKLHTYIAHWRARESAGCKALIAAGYGSEKLRETRARAATDADAAAYIRDWEACSAATAELDARRRWHGKDNPIRKPAWMRA